jgi:TolB protein
VTIYRVADTGGTAVAIATLPSSNLAIDHISWSAQEVLAFGVYDETQPTAVGSIYTVSAAGGVPTLFISGSSDNGGPAWSPTGNQLVFYSNRGGNYQLFVAEASSGQIVQLTNDTADDGVPSWSLRLSRRLQARELH